MTTSGLEAFDKVMLLINGYLQGDHYLTSCRIKLSVILPLSMMHYFKPLQLHVNSQNKEAKA